MTVLIFVRNSIELRIKLPQGCPLQGTLEVAIFSQEVVLSYRLFLKN